MCSERDKHAYLVSVQENRNGKKFVKKTYGTFICKEIPADDTLQHTKEKNHEEKRKYQKGSQLCSKRSGRRQVHTFRYRTDPRTSSVHPLRAQRKRIIR